MSGCAEVLKPTWTRWARPRCRRDACSPSFANCPPAKSPVEVDGKNAASIRSGQSFFKILGLPEEEFPPLPKFENAKVVTMRQKDLRDGLRKTAYAISTDETRYVLNGVLFSFKENKLTLVATDGRRLAMVDIELEFPRSHEADIIVPTKAVTELQRLLTDDGEVKISVGSGQIAFDLNNTLLVSKLIEGNYPNYKQVIPSEAKERVTLERETFLNSLRRVSLLASDKSNSIKLNFSKNNIEITANTPEVGEARESLPVAYKGRDFSIAFNPEFLMAPLRNLTEDEVFLRSHRRDESGRFENPDAISLRADADARQLVRRAA